MLSDIFSADVRQNTFDCFRITGYNLFSFGKG